MSGPQQGGTQQGQQLSLWAAAPLPADSVPNRPESGSQQAMDAIKKEIQASPGQTPAVPASPLAMPPANVLRHPQANRQIALEGAQVAYVLRRARRRSIGFRVDEDGLAVRAPHAASLAAIEGALQAKAGWIVRKLAEQQAWAQRQHSTRITWGDGAVLPYLGAPLAVRFDPEHHLATGGAPLLVAGVLHVPLARSAQAGQVRDAVQAWLLRQAHAHFTQRLDHFAPRLQVRWTRLALSGARSRWGSARADGSIRLNWRLMHFSPEVIDYVVVHELAHLRVMDHSPRFWSTVEAALPDWPQLRRRLRDEPTPPWT